MDFDRSQTDSDQTKREGEKRGEGGERTGSDPTSLPVRTGSPDQHPNGSTEYSVKEAHFLRIFLSIL